MLKKVETKIKKNKIKEIRRNARKYNIFSKLSFRTKRKNLYIKKCRKCLNEN